LQESVLPAWAKIQALLAEEGRAVESLGADFQIPTGTSAPATIDLLRRWQDAGGTHGAVCTMGPGFTTAEPHIDFFAGLRESCDDYAPAILLAI
jgi:hypothetical protein